MQTERHPGPHVHQEPASLQAVAGSIAGAGLFVLGDIDPQRLTWEHLETLRLKRLGIPNRYSRHLGKDFSMPRETHPLSGPAWNSSLKPTPASGVANRGNPRPPDGKGKGSKGNNSIAPFYTAAKPTCGYFFSRETDNKKKNFGIPASDLVKWRSFAQ